MVKPSPWPFFIGVFLFFVATGLAFFMHRIFYSGYILLPALGVIFYIVREWVADVEYEASVGGYHTLVVKKGLYRGFWLFVASEVMLFFGFFWAFFNSAISPSFVYAFLWPFDLAFRSLALIGFPMYNTGLLIFTIATVTFAHGSIASHKHEAALDGLYITIVLGIIFLISQVNEYYEITYNLNDSVYSSCFFMLTGLHGMHVLVGVFFLCRCIFRLTSQDYASLHYVGLVCGIWYWHFVDWVWIFLYLVVYLWGNWTIPSVSMSHVLDEYITYSQQLEFDLTKVRVRPARITDFHYISGRYK